ncbi:hypothetical protein ACFTZ8_31080 [Streptomyces fungicidicus]|uniref:hypothetical protein n=1 Tax=Streptomyces fungicidicus TaxID=68203 RepID=UPI0033BFF491
MSPLAWQLPPCSGRSELSALPSFPLPDGADAYVLVGCGIVMLAVLYGRRVHQFFDVVDVIRGG